MKYIIFIFLFVLSIFIFTNKDVISKYSANNLASVLGVDSDNYEEPQRDISKVAISIKSSTTTSVNTSIKSSPSIIRTMWTHYVDGKPRTNSDQSYPYGTNIIYYFTDWDNMNKYGFFLGWINEYTGSFISGSDKWSEYKFTLLRNTETVSKFQNCAKPFPQHVYFYNINYLEQKLVKFSRNIPDKNLKIKANGEVAAIAIQYKDGGVCAQFIEQCTTGSITCSADQLNNFFNSYDGKSIKQIFHYHTHDYNSGKNSKDKRYKDYHIEQGSKKMVYIPSLSDLFLLSLKVNAKINSKQFYIKGINDITEKVISPDGHGYIYDLPDSEKNLDIYLDDKVDESASIDAFNKGLLDSMAKNNRKKPINDDVLKGYNSMLKYYQNSYSAKFIPFMVN